MQNFRYITDKIVYLGADSTEKLLFENIFPIPNGVSYNSYLILEEKTALLDTVDSSVAAEFLKSLASALNGRTLDYLIINHMEPDHSFCIKQVVLLYPDITLVGNTKTFAMLSAFVPDIQTKQKIVTENDSLNLGGRTLTFAMAPMVHWPETMVTYDAFDNILFSADAFGTFGTLNDNLYATDVDFDVDYLDEARRYYSNIVGKYGVQVRALLAKAKNMNLKMICPLHGLIFTEETIPYIFEKYNIWSAWEAEDDGILVVYASMYGNTQHMALSLCNRLTEKKIDYAIFDASITDVSYLISAAFRYGKIIILSPTYNGGIFPKIETFILDIKAHNIQNKKFMIIDNGTWAATAGKTISKQLEELKNCQVIPQIVSIKSSVTQDNVNTAYSVLEELIKE